MSAVAGRVLIIPKGAYEAGETYYMLDLVKYNSKSFLAKRTNTNVTPVDGADWMELTNDGVTSFNGRSGAVSPANGDYDMTNLGDVNLSSPTDGQGLRYNSQSGKWENGDAASAVSNLTDVDLTNLANGQILKYNSTAQKWENVDEKGHTIQNASGTAQTQRASLQYKDAFVSDDSVNGRTIVENIKEVLPADYDSTTDEGIIVCDDGNDVPIGEIGVDYEEVTGDGVKTYQTLLKELCDEVDFSKVTDNAKLRVGNTLFSISRNKSGDLRFGCVSTSSGNAIEKRAICLSTTLGNNHYTSSTTTSSGTTFAKYDNDASGDGEKLTLYYGTSSTVINLKTSADYCMMSDGVTSVESALSYSTTEHVVGKWIDGRTLYEKTIDFGRMPNMTTKSVAHGISNLRFVYEIRGVTILESGNPHTTIPLPNVVAESANFSYQSQISVDPTNVNIVTSRDRSEWNAYVTLRYTKTS